MNRHPATTGRGDPAATTTASGLTLLAERHPPTQLVDKVLKEHDLVLLFRGFRRLH
jgi:hypothetical protein